MESFDVVICMEKYFNGLEHATLQCQFITVNFIINLYHLYLPSCDPEIVKSSKFAFNQSMTPKHLISNESHQNILALIVIKILCVKHKVNC
jgi:hypothetical protein